jgi:secreted protein with Ig-like and vWFA domain
MQLTDTQREAIQSAMEARVKDAQSAATYARVFRIRRPVGIAAAIALTIGASIWWTASAPRAVFPNVETGLPSGVDFNEDGIRDVSIAARFGQPRFSPRTDSGAYAERPGDAGNGIGSPSDHYLTLSEEFGTPLTGTPPAGVEVFYPRNWRDVRLHRDLAPTASPDRPSRDEIALQGLAEAKALEIGARKIAEAYAPVDDNPFLPVHQSPLSTFSIDVDTASYTNIRRFLNNGQLPPPDAVRIEEMVNFFEYDYAPPTGEHPFAVYVDLTECPWTPQHRLMRVALKGLEIPREERPPSNLVFLIDVSGSMQSSNKLPLVKDSLTLLTGELDRLDRVAIVVYAGSSGLVLPSTGGHRGDAILSALDNLSAGGSTNGGEGIQLAYDIASANFIEGGANRVILATDGDFNVGITDRSELTRLIEEKAASGVFLSVLGYGMGDLKDDTLEKLADRGNGHYAYIDSLDEARRVLVDQVGGTLVTIAKDVKIQIEFNPLAVAAYRLIGYENRMLAARDFNDDAKDAGEVGAGHTVTALYEVVPVGVDWLDAETADAADFAGGGEPSGPLPDGRGSAGSLPDGRGSETGGGNEIARDDTADTAVPPEPSRPDLPEVDPLRYQAGLAPTPAALGGETATVKLRYKQPDGEISRLITYSVADDGGTLEQASGDLRFAAAVASFGMLLRHSPHAGGWTLDAVQELAAGALGDDPQGYQAEFLQLVEMARALQAR